MPSPDPYATPPEELEAAAAHADAEGGYGDVGDPTVCCKGAPPAITVHIEPDKLVACPGLLSDLKAIGTPPGGTFAWTIKAPAAYLVDKDRNPIYTGDVVNLWGFQSDNDTGYTPAQTAEVSVTYTYTNGQTNTFSLTVLIHEIRFAVTNDDIQDGETDVSSSSAGVKIDHGFRKPTISSSPQVEIQLDDICPRMGECAQNHQLGWVQRVNSSIAVITYDETETSWTPPMPLPDSHITNHPPVTFYDNPAKFENHKDKKRADFQDSPGIGNGEDPRAGLDSHPVPWNDQKATGSYLQRIEKGMSFTSWLVVQNIAWSSHHLGDSFGFLGHFSWGMAVTVEVDASRRSTRLINQRDKPDIPPKRIVTGRGNEAPLVLNTPSFNYVVKNLLKEPYYTVKKNAP